MPATITIDFGDVQSPTQFQSLAWGPSNANAGQPITAQTTDFVVTRNSDGYSVILAQYMVSGQQFASVTVQIIRDDGTGVNYTFANAILEVFSANNQIDTVGVNFTAYTVSYS